MEDLLAHLARVATDLDAVLCDDSLAGLTDAARVEVLQAAGKVLRRVGAVVVETVATADPVDLAHGAGCRSANELLQRTLLVDAAAAARTVKAAGFTRRESSLVSGERLPARWPELRGALLDGAVGVAGLLAAIGPIERISDRIGAEERLTADAFLADSARGIDQGDPNAVEGDAAPVRDDATGPGAMPEDLARLSQHIVTVLDPDGEEPDDQQALHRRGLVIGRLRQGLHRVTGHLLPDTAAQLQSILDAMLNPKVDAPPMPVTGSGVRFEESSDGADASDGGGNHGRDDDPFNSDPRAVIDPRTHAQKRHDAFAAALGIAARHKEMPSLGGAAPTLVVTVDANDLARGAGRARLPGSDATIPVAAAEHIGCTGAVQRVLLDEGKIVGITTTDRVFTVHQRRAIVARDEECLIPGCHVPASWCEIHHVVEHARGGPTSTDNGVPLCWWHHRSLGSSGWEIRMDDGLPQVRGPGWWDRERRWRTPAPVARGRIDLPPRRSQAPRRYPSPRRSQPPHPRTAA
ncbi:MULTISPECIES: HNH endonuclease signature motif containing protein [unclassified Microbacterium]|uniref:HNH endonuclease signature motif containing protein n=1 Tax=unclassified Microbacterium TaxID=2609290 RepID=UPI00341CA148